MRVIALAAILCGMLFCLGFLADRHTDRMGLSVLAEPRLVTVVVTLKDVTDAYRWLSVYGCSAEVTDTGSFCTGDFERESSLELHGRKQELIYWRDLPGGTLRVTAMAFDGNQQLLAKNQVTVFRGR